MIVVRFIAALMIALAAVTPAPPWSGLPVRPATRRGIAGDPVNIAVEGSRLASP